MARSLSLLALAALAGCADAAASLRARETYQALGHEPSWTLTIRGDRLKFAGSEPRMLMEIVRPLAEPLPYGRRYATERLTLEITRQPCNDVHSGVAFSDTVVVVVDRYPFRGCGGERVPLLDL